MEVKDYINILKEIKDIGKKEKIDLDENMAIAIMQEIGKDKRTPNYSNGSDNEEASEKQINFLKKLGYEEDTENLTKDEAREKISELVDSKNK